MRRLREEAGLSLVPAVGLMAILVLLGGVALQQAIGALRDSSRHYDTKRALQAADAALDAALYALNRADLGGALQVDPLRPWEVLRQNCIVSGGQVGGDIDLAELPVTAPTDGQGRRWCAATGAEDLGEGVTFQYRVSQLVRIGADQCGAGGTLSLDREIVAVGTSRGITRRLKARAQAAIALLSGAAVQSSSPDANLSMSGTARILGAAQSNAHIIGAATNSIAGNATPGPGHVVSGPIVAGSTTPACHPFHLPAVVIGNARDSNHNGQWDGTRCHDGLTGLAISCKPLLTTTGGVRWEQGGQRTLEVWGNGRLVLNGDTYALCRLRVRDSAQLVIRSTTPLTRLFMDDPEHCSGVTGAGQVHVDGQARIINCHPQTQPQTLQLYALASTTQTLAGAGLLSGALMAAVCGLNIPLAGVPMTVYAPASHVQIGGTTTIAGQVAGKSVEMSGAAAVQPVNALVNLNRLGAKPVLPLYRRVGYVECTGMGFAQLPAGDPAQGC